MVKEKVKPLDLTLELTSNQNELVLYNDNVNDFDFVIETLIEVCELDAIQAEQITLIVHEKGKCGVISGSVKELEPYYKQLTLKGLTVSIE